MPVERFQVDVLQVQVILMIYINYQSLETAFREAMMSQWSEHFW